ncbi:MAG: hypothetical protein LBT81_04665, partial [Helicobacteraceae bacterium]|nr:hypothetical protein [Helicobacteraceae bacterium]
LPRRFACFLQSSGLASYPYKPHLSSKTRAAFLRQEGGKLKDRRGSAFGFAVSSLLPNKD